MQRPQVPSTQTGAVGGAPPKAAPPLPHRLDEVFEGLITRLLYQPKGQGAAKKAKSNVGPTGVAPIPVVDESAQDYQRLGLSSPLWWWTHRGLPQQQQSAGAAGSGANTLAEREAKMVYHLLQWLHYADGIDMTAVHVLTMSDVVAELEKLFPDPSSPSSSSAAAATTTATAAAVEPSTTAGETPKIFFGAEVISLQQYALRVLKAQSQPPAADAPPAKAPAAATTPGVAIWAIGTAFTAASARTLSDKEEYLARFLAENSSRAALIVSECGWAQPEVPWMGLRNVTQRKLAEETVGCYEGLVGARLPVCCPMHCETERDAVSGVTSFAGFCKRVCLQPYPCGEATHRCTRTCHPGGNPATRHSRCPYACTKSMPCGHPCKMTCGEPCNCLTIVEADLPCSHREVVGMDRERNEPMFAEVRHKFRGFCRDAEYPCSVVCPTTCSACLAIVHVQCSVLSEGFLSAGAATEGTLCDDCRTSKVRIRHEARIELIQKGNKEREERKKRYLRDVAEQTKAAGVGIFAEGQRLLVRSNAGIRDPIEENYPQVAGSWVPSGAQLEGQQCIVVSREVDETDVSEMLYLVRFDDGLHALLADEGLSLIRAVTAGQKGGLGAAPLLLTAAGAGQGTAAPLPSGEDDSPPPPSAMSTAPTATAAAAPISATTIVYDSLPAIGSVMHLAQSLPVADPLDPTRDIRLCNVVVTVRGHASAETVSVRYEPCGSLASLAIAFIRVQDQSTTENDENGASGAKRQRIEGGEPSVTVPSTTASPPPPEAAANGNGLLYLDFTCPADFLKPLFLPGDQVIVADPQSQAVTLSDKQTIPQLAIHLTATAKLNANEGPLRPHRLYPTRLAPNESCRVVGVVNAPTAALRPTPTGSTSPPPEESETSTAAAAAQLRLSVTGPFYILQPQRDVEAVQMHASGVATGGGGVRTVGQKAGRELPRNTEPPGPRYTLVALGAVTRDEDFEADKALEGATLLELDSLSDERFAERVAARRLKNEELSYRKLLIMRKNKTSADSAEAICTPVPLPTKAMIDALEAKFNLSGHADAALVENAVRKDRQIRADAKAKVNQLSMRLKEQHLREREADKAFALAMRGATTQQQPQQQQQMPRPPGPPYPGAGQQPYRPGQPPSQAYGANPNSGPMYRR